MAPLSIPDDLAFSTDLFAEPIQIGKEGGPWVDTLGVFKAPSDGDYLVSTRRVFKVGDLGTSGEQPMVRVSHTFVKGLGIDPDELRVIVRGEMYQVSDIKPLGYGHARVKLQELP